jgi:hypothetical protein
MSSKQSYYKGSFQIGYTKTWLIQNSVIQNFTIIQILFELRSQGGKTHTNLPGYLKNLGNSNSKEYSAL